MPGSTSGQLFITNLSHEIDWKLLKDHCRTCGVSACRANIVYDPKSGRSTGQALVDLDANNCTIRGCGVRLTGTILAGRPMFACPDLGYLRRNSADSFVEPLGWQAPPDEVRKQQPAAGMPWRHRGSDDLCRLQRSRSPSQRPVSNQPWGDHRWDGRQPKAASPHLVPPPPEPCMKRQPRQAQEDQAVRRLFVEGLASTVTWQALKEFVTYHASPVAYAGVVHTDDEDSYGIVEFDTHSQALEACFKLNGSMLHKKVLRLRQDRSEFDDLRRLAHTKCAALVRPPRPAGWGASHEDAQADKEDESSEYVGEPEVTG